MTAFVILAAGPGKRMGRAGSGLHKALAPLGSKAVISRQIELAPAWAEIIVCTGSRAEQVRGYLELAHPGRKITFVHIDDWDKPGNGPGATLLATRGIVGDDDLVFTSCDTLWRPDEALWAAQKSWAAVAPVPSGTELEQWCRISSFEGIAVAVHDKSSEDPAATDAYTGLSRILARDLPVFWKGIEHAALNHGERRDVTGLQALARENRLTVRRIAWTDTGDEVAYNRAVANFSGYDWSKPGEVTYVLPETRRVVKYRADSEAIARRAFRQEQIEHAVPPLTGSRTGMFAYEYVEGTTAYAAAERDPDLVPKLLDWAKAKLWKPVKVTDTWTACNQFYRVKTEARIDLLPRGLRHIAWDAANRVRWQALTRRCEPVTFHGDFNLGNVIVRPDGGFAGIDWREDFGGETAWGDRRYDLGKLAAGLIVHWENAQRGDFRPWEAGQWHLAQLAHWLGGDEVPRDIMTIAAVSMLNCAPLHASPLDEILVARAVALLEELE